MHQNPSEATKPEKYLEKEKQNEENELSKKWTSLRWRLDYHWFVKLSFLNYLSKQSLTNVVTNSANDK